jgi:hypothetical protein
VGGGPAAFAPVDSLAGSGFALALGRSHGRRLAFRLLTDSGTSELATGLQQRALAAVVDEQGTLL